MPLPEFSTLEYTPLSLEHEEIRLLRIDTESERHTLTHGVSMRVQRLRYVALSYPWGEPTPPLEKRDTVDEHGYVGGRTCKGGRLFINGCSILVSLNLYNAIKGTIRFWRQTNPHEKEFYLWCDQICIHQKSVNERGQQVAQMGAIYKRAEQVFVWLPVTKAPGIVDTIAHWNAHHELHDIREEALKAADQDSQVKFYYGVERACKAWQHVQMIAASSWWSRAWIYQEFVSGCRVTFLIDEASIDWRELRDCMKHGFSQIAEKRPLCRKVLRQLDELYKSNNPIRFLIRESEVFKKIFSAAPKTSLSPSARFDQHLRSIISLVRHFDEQSSFSTSHAWSMVQTVLDGKSTWSESQLVSVVEQAKSSSLKATKAIDNSDIAKVNDSVHLSSVNGSLNGPPVSNHSNGSTSNGSSNAPKAKDHDSYVLLSRLLPHAQNSRCADPRDKIYAFLGLLDPAYGINADYSDKNTVEHTMTSAAKSVITVEKSLLILTLATQLRAPSRTENHFPSWVPEYNLTQVESSRYRQYLHDIQLPSEGCSASGDTKPVVSFWKDQHGNPDRLLKVRGFRVDLLHRVERDAPLEHWQIFAAATTPSLRIGTPSSAKSGDEVWILLGLNVPLTLTRPSKRDANYIILGVTMLWDEQQPSSIMQGSMMRAVDAGEVEMEDIYII